MKVLFLLIALAASMGVKAQIGETFEAKDIEKNKLTYQITADHAVTLCRGKKYEKLKRVNVPETVLNGKEQYKVVAIEPGCFADLPLLCEVTLPQTITDLPSGVSTSVSEQGGAIGMFSSCGALQKVVLPPSVLSIGAKAFSRCTSLRQIDIPESVVEMGGGCFYGCTALESIKLPPLLLELPTLSWSYRNSDKVYYNGFFESCRSLKYVDIPQSVSQIGIECFNGCTSLCEVALPRHLNELGENCFVDCKNLKKVSGLYAGLFKIEVQTAMFAGSSFNIDSLASTYSYYAKGYVKSEITKWQQKNEFETTAQYRQRVNKESRNQKIRDLLEVSKRDYLTSPSVRITKCTLGKYEADLGVFTLQLTVDRFCQKGEQVIKYIKVSQADAQKFKKAFAPQNINGTYILMNDQCQLDDVTFIMGGKTYHSEKGLVENTSSDMAFDLPEFDVEEVAGGNAGHSTVMDKTLDVNIPQTSHHSNNMFAVVIGNENYQQVASVPFARNDAKVFADYCQKTLGMLSANIRIYQNATYGVMLSAINDIKSIAAAYNGDISVLFYYAGHGIPNEKNSDACLLPVDADGKQMDVCYPVSKLYSELGSMGVQRVVVFLDACFSGARRGEGMLHSARGVAIKAKPTTPQGNMVVFSAASGDETAYPYNEKGHGMFTYFLLKKLQESKGDCSLGELGLFVEQNVKQQSVVINRKSQTPTVIPSSSYSTRWKEEKLLNY